MILPVVSMISQNTRNRTVKFLIQAKIPSRDAYPTDISNVHSSLLERCSKPNNSINSGTITALPIVETINDDITEHITTNIISITDSQLYTNKRSVFDNQLPAIDSGLSVSRIGSNAQCKSTKIVSSNIKNELTNYRNAIQLSVIDIARLATSNAISFQDHL